MQDFKHYIDSYTIEKLEELLVDYKEQEAMARGLYHYNDPAAFLYENLDDNYDDYVGDYPSSDDDYEYYEREIVRVENAIGFKKRQNTENNNINTPRSLNNISNTNSDLLNFGKQIETLYKEGIPNVVIKATATQHGNTIWYTVLLSVSQYYLNNHQNNYICKFIPNEFIKLLKKYKFILKSIFSKKSPLLLFLNILFILLGLNILISLPTLPAYKTLYSVVKETFSLNNNFFNNYTYPDYKKTIGESEQVKLELNIHKELILKNTNKKLVIIIDELDRCSKENLIQFFDSIENFINIKNITFIFSLNPKILQSKNTSLDMVYLDKYFKIPYYLPPVTDFDNFIKHKISEIFDKKEIESITKLIKEISLYRNTTPRLLNKLFNLIIIYKSDFPELSLLEFSQIFIYYYTYNNEVDKLYDPFSKKIHVLFEDFIDSDSSIITNQNFTLIPLSIRKTFYSETRNLNLSSFLKTTRKLKRILKID